MKQVLRLRKLMYKLGILSPVRLPSLVVSVGNISLGGTGKSPLIAHLAEWLICDMRRRVLLLTRGYGRKSKIPVYVGPADALPSSQAIGDEPWMIRNRVPGLSILVHRNRAHQAEEVWSSLGDPEVVLMDDAFQHWKAERDIDIVTVDATEGIDLPVLPFGRLREPAVALGRADIVIITRANEVEQKNLDSLLARVREFTRVKESVLWKSDRCAKKDIPVLQVDYELSGLFLHDELLSLDTLKHRPLVLISGIAKPKSFRLLLEREGLEILHHISLNDHAYPDERDFVNLKNILETEPRSMLVTTEKDWARLHQWFNERDLIPACTKIRLRFRGDGEARLHRFIEEIL